MHTGTKLALLGAVVAVLGFWAWGQGWFPFRLRSDGIYSGTNAPANAPATDATIERPKLYLPAPQRQRSGYRAVQRVIDGDTLELDGEERVRLIGVDTDELGEDRVQPAGAGWKATLYVFELLEPDAQVRLVFDDERKDKYGRTLAYVYLPGGEMLNELLLQQGWARTMKIAPNTKHAKRFTELEKQAKAAGLGRWTGE